MGGAFAQMGDPLTVNVSKHVMLPEELAKEYCKSIQLNLVPYLIKKLVEFNFSALELDRLRQISDMTGISLDRINKIGNTGGKIRTVKRSIWM